MRVRFNTTEFKTGVAIQCCMNLIQHAIFFDAAATVSDQYTCISRDFIFDLSDLTFTKMDLRCITNTEIIHHITFIDCYDFDIRYGLTRVL